MEPNAPTRRLFFALWPSEVLREQLAAASRHIVARGGGRSIPPQNFHITLAFLGSVAATQVPAVTAAAAAIEGAPLQLSIERLEVWRSAGILCLTPAPSPPLSDFVDRLRIKLLAQQVEPDQKEFRPHVTLARDWRDFGVEGSVGPFEWRADEFVLIESAATRDGSSYRIIGRWPLTGEKRL
jgi:RNA 2',3'-cyclic 3'-phosphodiesterase